MKKLLLSILTLSMVVTVSAQDYTKKAVRDAKRTERQEEMAQQMSTALKSHNFTFSASFMIPQFEGHGRLLNQWNNYVAIYPGYMEVTLPYISVAQDMTLIPKRIAINTTTFTFWEDMNNDSQWTLVFQTESQGVKYVFHLNYNMATNAAKLTLVPNVGNTVTYTGAIQAH